jgi:DNA-binding PadR family transcriptional regulator
MKLGYMLLGLINIHPKVSGYQLKAIIDGSTSYFYTVHLSQIYPELKRMLKDGWLDVVEIAGDGKPNSKAYSLTSAGAEALDVWLTEPMEFKPKSRESHNLYVLKLILMGHMSDDVINNYLRMGIDYFESEKQLLLTQNLSLEEGFLDAIPSRESYLSIWNQEIKFIVAEVDLRIKWLKNMLKEREG